MKGLLDWQDEKVVDIYDEVSLWSAPFGRLLLENIPMRRGMKVLDLGFGTGFPLVELSQRLGNESQIYGVDIWEAAMERTRKKISTLEIENITIFNHSATKIELDNDSIDLVTSNLGINNFEDRQQVYSEVSRILKEGGSLALTTNPVGTFRELFEVFDDSLKYCGLDKERILLEGYLKKRNTKEGIIREIEQVNLKHILTRHDETNMRFTCSRSMLDHNLMRIGFRAGWNQFVGKENQLMFYNNVIKKIDNHIEEHGEFRITIPMLYLEFVK